MHPEDIKAAIRKRGLTLTEIAASMKGTPTKGAVSRVVHGLVKSRAIAARISAVIELPVATLWPGKYPDLEALERLRKARPALAQGIEQSAAKAASTTGARRATNRRSA